ncbi:hypothetical protein YC2023_119670 [Brassica napus]|uniref:(rape) hypothetical protein n=1 Tax=Brassica napus TaxID=3708 RepID=A0A816JB94_BRANA|nr:unnamed protein product [Brassica napus]
MFKSLLETGMERNMATSPKEDRTRFLSVSMSIIMPTIKSRSIGHKKAQGLADSQSPLLQSLCCYGLFSFISISSSPVKNSLLQSSSTINIFTSHNSYLPG